MNRQEFIDLIIDEFKYIATFEMSAYNIFIGSSFDNVKHYMRIMISEDVSLNVAVSINNKKAKIQYIMQTADIYDAKEQTFMIRISNIKVAKMLVRRLQETKIIQQIEDGLYDDLY